MQFGISVVGYSKTGLIPVISTKLPFLNRSTSIDTFLYRFSTPIGMLLGQGDQYQTGLFGSYPIPNFDDYVAYSYSFFILDTILDTPRGDQNAFLIALLFLPKSIAINKILIQEIFDSHLKSLNNLDDLISKDNFERLVNTIKEKVFFGFEQITPEFDKELLSELQESDQINEESDTGKHVYINLDTEPESIIALPWILHAVYHGLEQATIDILGESSPLLEMLMEQYTAEILERYHLFDSIFNKAQPELKDALDLGVQHLAKVGEFVTIKPLDTNKFECSINCSFAGAVHPYLPINKCLWVRYLTAIVRYTLPTDKELVIQPSSFDPEFGSKTIIEIVPKVFKEV